MLQQKQNLVVISHAQYFQKRGVQKQHYLFFQTLNQIFSRRNEEKHTFLLEDHVCLHLYTSYFKVS